MIIPTYSEDEILRELIFDYKIVKRMAKKIAIAYLNKNSINAEYGRQLLNMYGKMTGSNAWSNKPYYDNGKWKSDK